MTSAVLPEGDEPPLVVLRWTTDAPGPAGRQLIAHAGENDADMGFGSNSWQTNDQRNLLTAEVHTRLRRWNAPRSASPALAAVVSIKSSAFDSTFIVDAIVHPDFRSTGVITATFEAIEKDPHPALVPGSGNYLSCAFGSHPAALRAAHRIGARPIAVRDVMALPPHVSSHERTKESHSAPGELTHVAGIGTSSRAQTRWQLVDGSTSQRIYAVASTGGQPAGWFAIEDRLNARRLIVLGTNPSVRDTNDALREIVGAALPLLRTGGGDVIEAVVEHGQHALLEILRSAAFQHDRTDVIFESDGLFTTTGLS